MSAQKKDLNKVRIEVVVVFLLGIILIFLLLAYFSRKKTPPSTRIIPTRAIDAYPLPTGPQIYNVSYGDGVNNKPKISNIKVDPLDPSLGGTQKISFSASSPLPLVQIASVLITDKKKKILSFKLIKGTTQNGEWSAQWQMNDTYNKTYKIIFHLVNKSEARDDEIVFR